MRISSAVGSPAGRKDAALFVPDWGLGGAGAPWARSAAPSTLVRNVEVAAAPDARSFQKSGEPALLAAQRVKQAQCFIHGQVTTEVGQCALDRRRLRWARRPGGAGWRAAARSTRTARAAQSRSRTASGWRLSGRRRLPLRVLGLRANEVEDLVYELDVEFRVAVSRIETQRLDVRGPCVEDPAQAEERVAPIVEGDRARARTFRVVQCAPVC